MTQGLSPPSGVRAEVVDDDASCVCLFRIPKKRPFRWPRYHISCGARPATGFQIVWSLFIASSSGGTKGSDASCCSWFCNEGQGRSLRDGPDVDTQACDDVDVDVDPSRAAATKQIRRFFMAKSQGRSC